MHITNLNQLFLGHVQRNFFKEQFCPMPKFKCLPCRPLDAPPKVCSNLEFTA
jgi:hypothetical protein